MFRSFFARGLCAAIVALTASVANARADLAIRITPNGFAPLVIFSVGGSNPVGSATGSYGGFTYNVLGASSNSPGSPTFSQMFSSTTTITNNDTVARTFRIEVGSTGFTQLTGQTTMFSHIGTTVGITGGGTMTYQAYANNDNGQFSTTGSTPGVQNPNISTANSSDSNDASTTANMGSLYSLTQVFIITLQPGGSINFSTNLNLTAAAVPEPATMLGALVGFGSIGFYRLRRRTPKAVD